MSRKLKKLLLNLLERKKLLLALLFFVILGLFLPLHSAQAIAPLVAWGLFLAIAAVSGITIDALGGRILGSTLGHLALVLAILILQIPLLVTNVFLSLSIGILALVTSPNFILLSYTNPVKNEFLAVGWALTRNLTNIGFVIVLVIIGLATALKIREYQWQKTLPLLIGIALLINFTPVILGLIVDASNIVMHFFLGDMIDLTFVEKIWKGQFDALLGSAAWSPETFNLLPFAQTLFLIVFGFIAGCTFLLFSLLFILRYIAIWMLVILSPIAFFCYILPATRGLFRTWWNQFIQWSFIGVAAAFFLRLSSQLLLLSWEGKVMRVIETEEKVTPLIGDMINQLLPYSIGIGFLIVGFFVALSTSAMGATGIITAVQKGARAMPAATARWIAKRRPVQKALGAMAGETAAGLARSEEWLRGRKGRIGKALAAIPLAAAWVTRRTTEPALLKYAARARRYIPPKEFDDMSPEEQTRFSQSLVLKEDRVVALSRMKEKETLQKTNEEFQKKAIIEAEGLAASPYFKKEVANIMNALPDKITKKMKIDWEFTAEDKAKMRDKIERLSKELGISENEAASRIHIIGLKPGDIPAVAKRAINTKNFRLGSQEMTPEHFQSLIRNFDKEIVWGVLDKEGGVSEIIKTPKDLEKFYRKNPRLVRWFMTHPAGKIWNWQGEKFMPKGGFKEFEKKMKKSP